MTILGRPPKAGRAAPVRGLRAGLPRLPFAPEEVPALNDALQRTGPLSSEIDGAAVSMTPIAGSGGPVDMEIARWFGLRVHGKTVVIGVSDRLIRPVADLPTALGLEFAFDPFLRALEDRVGTVVELCVPAPKGAFRHRHAYAVEWGDDAGQVVVKFNDPAAPLIASVLGGLPFEAPPLRDLPVRAHVRIGSFEVATDRLARMRPGEMFLPRRDELTPERGLLVVDGRVHGPVALSETGAALDAAGTGQGGDGADTRDIVTFGLCCAPTGRAALAACAPGDPLPMAAGYPGRVALFRRSRRIGTGALVRLGAHIAVELRGWERGFATALRRRAAGEKIATASNPSD